MRLTLFVCFAMLLLSLTLSVPSAHAQIWAPDHSPVQIGIGYQYSHYNVFGKTFNNNGEDVSFSYHILDPLTGNTSRITGALEGSLAAGFGGQTSGLPSLHASSVFLGGGPHLTLESSSRFEPWIHLLVGLDHVRFTQTATLGSANAFGFLGGGGVDVKVTGPIYWRVQADYLGTRFTSWIQSNYSIGTGLVFNF